MDQVHDDLSVSAEAPRRGVPRPRSVDPLSPAEIRAVVETVRRDPEFGSDACFETIQLLEPWPEGESDVGRQ